MYGRALLSLYGGCTSGRRLTCRSADLVCRLLSVSAVIRSEKSPPENNGAGKAPGEAEEKTSPLHEDESAKSPNHDSLVALLKSMKVEVSSKKMFQEMKDKKTKQQSQKITDMDSASRMFQMAAEESHPDEEKPVSKELADAASVVASTYPTQQRQVESELLQQLRLHKQMAEDVRRKGAENISKVITGMKVKKQMSDTASKSVSHTEQKLMRDATKMSLHSGTRLQIFPVSAPSKTPIATGSAIITEHYDSAVTVSIDGGGLTAGMKVSDRVQSQQREITPTLWDLELAKEIADACEQPPRNGFEEMIQWTKEGKLWTFPINNEDGLDEEQKVEFHEHIFLEKYLEDFPMHGPIRHFMELVICGLSKNPYLTVQQKKEHIDWFRDYFHKKEDLLRECDVFTN